MYFKFPVDKLKGSSLDKTCQPFYHKHFIGLCHKGYHFSTQIMRSIQIVFYIATVGLVRSVTIPPAPIWPPGKCIDKSLSIPSWVIRDFKSTAQGSATFSVTNRASDTSGSVRCASSACTVSGNAALSVSMSSGSGNPVVTLKEAWMCNDNDLERE